jgi:hypothetical protein
MSFITLFTAPKPFTDPRIALIQRNAIESWTRLSDVEVLLMGDEEGLQQAAAGFKVRHVRDILRNESGTPLVSSMVRAARENSASELLCIINSDIILLADFVEGARHVLALKDRFVLLGRRWDLPVHAPIEFAAGWEERLRAAVRAQGCLHRPAGSDFFLFPRSCYADLPDFAVGRAGWDNWMIYKARKERWPVVDGTASFMIVHQSHDYSHLPGGAPHYAVPETDENIRLAGSEAAIRYTVLDATHWLMRKKLARPDMSYLRFMRGVELFLRAVFFFLPEAMIEQVARPKRWKKRFLRFLGIRA